MWIYIENRTKPNQSKPHKKTEAEINNNMFPFKIGCSYASPREKWSCAHTHIAKHKYANFNELFGFAATFAQVFALCRYELQWIFQLWTNDSLAPAVALSLSLSFFINYCFSSFLIRMLRAYSRCLHTLCCSTSLTGRSLRTYLHAKIVFITACPKQHSLHL